MTAIAFPSAKTRTMEVVDGSRGANAAIVTGKRFTGIAFRFPLLAFSAADPLIEEKSRELAEKDT